MNKLGFVLQVTSSGAGNRIECNSGTWIKNVVDCRLDLDLFTGLRGLSNTVTSMQFSEFGCYIMSRRCIDGRSGDCICGWLFIPAGLDIADDEVMYTFRIVNKIVGMSNFTDVEGKIKSFFDKPYDEKSVKFQYSPSSGDKYGLRYYNGEEGLKDIIGKNRYQAYYSQYKAVFLLDSNSVVQVNPESVRFFYDLSKFKIDEYGVLMPPTTDALSLMGRGTSVILPNGQVFDNPLPMKLGDTVNLIARRKDFDDVNLPVTVKHAEQSFPLFSKIEWKKIIGRSFFKVSGQDGEPIYSFKITVNGRDITNCDTELTEKECSNAEVCVKANGYDDYKETVNLLNRVSQVPITLHKAVREVEYEVQLSNGKYADMTLSSKYLDDDSKSPLEGYSLNDRKGKLSVDPRHKRKYWAYGVLTAVVVYVIVLACMSIGNWLKTHEFQAGWPPVKEIQKDSVDADSEIGETSVTPKDAAAISYLNREKQWRKDSLSHYELTKDLYDLLNNYEFQELMYKQIDECKQYEEIKDVATLAANSGVHISGKYSEDGTITIYSWIKNVEQKIDAASSESYPPVKPNDFTKDGMTEESSKGEISKNKNPKNNKEEPSEKKSKQKQSKKDPGKNDQKTGNKQQTASQTDL